MDIENIEIRYKFQKKEIGITFSNKYIYREMSNGRDAKRILEKFNRGHEKYLELQK